MEAVTVEEKKATTRKQQMTFDEFKKLSVPERKKLSKDEIKKIYEYERSKDREMVRGIFRFHEVAGGAMSFSFRAWPGDQIENYDLVDGNIYTVPLGVAKHLNKNCKYPVHSYMKDENGKSIAKVNEHVKRTSFQSLEFIDETDLNPEKQIITVEVLR